MVEDFIAPAWQRDRVSVLYSKGRWFKSRRRQPWKSYLLLDENSSIDAIIVAGAL